MNRAGLIATLDLLKPALSKDNIVPVFTNFCFDAGTVHAYKDSLGISAPCEINDTFAVHGRTFMELLAASSSKEIDIVLDKENVLLKAGKSKMKLPFLEKDEFAFEEPENEQWTIIADIDEHFLTGLELCLISASSDYTMPAFMGVTIKGGKNVYLYSCDGDSLSRYQLDSWNASDEMYVLPRDFCEALIAIAEKTGFKAGQFYCNSEWAVAEMGNNFKLFGRIIENPDPMDFEAHIKRMMKASPTFVEIPDALDASLDRAEVVGNPESKSTSLKVEGGKLIINTETTVGEVKDSIRLDGHPDIEASVSASVIHRAVKVCDQFALTENCTMYRKGDDYFLIIGNYSE